MRCIIERTWGLEICNTKIEAIAKARKDLKDNPRTEQILVYYHPDTKESIRSVGKNSFGAIWFVVGRKNTENIINFVKA